MGIASESIPLAGDFTAPLALSFGGINDLMLGIRAILNVGASADYNGIYLIEPSILAASGSYSSMDSHPRRSFGETSPPMQCKIR